MPSPPSASRSPREKGETNHSTATTTAAVGGRPTRSPDEWGDALPALGAALLFAAVTFLALARMKRCEAPHRGADVGRDRNREGGPALSPRQPTGSLYFLGGFLLFGGFISLVLGAL